MQWAARTREAGMSITRAATAPATAGSRTASNASSRPRGRTRRPHRPLRQERHHLEQDRVQAGGGALACRPQPGVRHPPLARPRAAVNRDAYQTLPPELGGRNTARETSRLTDVWALPTSAGRGGHGAQFPLALPGRCIALSSDEPDLVLDVCVGSGTTAVAALVLARRCVGFDASAEYIERARERVERSSHTNTPARSGCAVPRELRPE